MIAVMSFPPELSEAAIPPVTETLPVLLLDSSVAKPVTWSGVLLHGRNVFRAILPRERLSMMYELVLASLYFSFLLGTKKEKGIGLRRRQILV